MKIKWVLIKSLSVFLAVLMAILVVPLSVYAEIFDFPETAAVEDAASGKLIKPEVYELVDRREENVKHFKLADGTVTAVMYEVPVHYLDSEGEWQDIDNTLADNGNEYSTPNAKVKFAKKTPGNGTIFTLHENNTKVTLSLDGANKKVSGQVTNTVTEHGEEATELQKQMTLDKLSSRILYPNILDGVDLEYVINSGNIKENLIVNQKLDNYSFSFTMSLNNLIAVLNADGSISLKSTDDDSVVYSIPCGYMYDANGQTSEAVTYTLTDLGNGKYTFGVTADPTWINAEGRAFPVTIDPPIVIGSSNITDLYISPSSPSSNFESFYLMYAGDDIFLYLKADSLPSIPESAYITDAYVSLFSDNWNGQCIGVYRVTSDWDSTLTWNSSMSSGCGARSNELLDFNCCNIDEESASYRVSWNITSLVKKWYDGTYPNYGIYFTDVDPDENADAVVFAPSEHPDSTVTPYFTINYRDMKGVESYWTYISQSAGLAGAGSINVATGNLTFVQSTVASTDNLFGFSPSFVYDAASAGDDYCAVDEGYVLPYMPYGFKLNMSETIVQRSYRQPNGDNVIYYVWFDADGTEHSFFNMSGSSTKFKDEDGLDLELSVTGNVCTITDSNHTVRNFTVHEFSIGERFWYLTSITDKSYNTLEFVFDDRIPIGVNIIPNGMSEPIEQLKITYNGGVCPAVIWCPHSGEAMMFKYSNTPSGSIETNAYKYLREIVYVSNTGDSDPGEAQWLAYYGGAANSNITVNASAHYTYDASGRLTSAEDGESGYGVRYVYSSGKVSAVQEYAPDNTAGQRIELSYSDDYTVLKASGKDDILGTSDDVLTTYIFDHFGRVINAYSHNLDRTEIYGVSSGEYEAENAPNKLKVSSQSVGSNSANYLLDGSFEDGLYYWNYNADGANDVYSTAITSLRKLNEKALCFPIAGLSNETIKQYVKLLPGSYSLSVDIPSSIPENASVMLKARSLSRNYTVTELVENTDSVGRYYAHLDFTAQSVSGGKEIFEISISVCGSYTFSSGSVIIDDAMLAKATGAQNYNMVKAGDFEVTSVHESGSTRYIPKTFWFTNTETNSRVLVDETKTGISGNYLTVNGEIGKAVTAQQSIYYAGFDSVTAEALEHMGYSYPVALSVSAFGKADSVIPNSSSFFGIKLKVEYYTLGGSEEEIYRFAFSKETDEWQYLSGTCVIPAGMPVKRVTVYCEYTNNVGTACFDNISVQCDVSDNIDQYYYNDEGLLGIQVSGDDAILYEYYSNGNLLCSTDKNGYTILYTYDRKNRVTKEEVYTFDGEFWYGNIIDQSGFLKPSLDTAWTSFEANLGNFTLKYINEYAYNNYGLPTDSIFKSYPDNTLGFDAEENLDPDEILTSATTYNLGTSKHFGSVATETDSLGRTTRYFYDENSGRLTAIINPDESSGTAYEYDSFGRLDTVRPATYSSSSASAQIDAESVEYTYSGGLLSSIRTESTDYILSYDVFGNNTEIKAGNYELASYTYNSNNGKLSSVTYGNGFKVSYTYDALDRVETVLYNNTVVHRYHYDSQGNISKFEDLANNKTYVYRYNVKGQLVEMYEQSGNDTTAWTLIFYDDESRPKQLSYFMSYAVGSGSAVLDTDHINTYDDDGNVELYKVKSGNVSYIFDLTYDSLNRIDSRTASLVTSSGTLTNTVDYEFTANGTNTSLQISKYISTIGSTSTTYQYVYDANGNITHIKDADNNIKCRYTYDDLGQLIREDNMAKGASYRYYYDLAGNITKRETYDFSITGLGDVKKTETLGYNDSSWGDRLTSWQGTTITYDEIGNPTWYSIDYLTCLLTWNGRQLASFENMDGLRTYTYNDEGIRIAKNDRGTLHTYQVNGTQIVSETWGIHTIFYVYDEMGSIAGMRYRTSNYAEGVFDEYLFEKNLQGDVVAIYNASGIKLVSYTYDAWGKVTTAYHNGGASTGARYNPFRYRGYYYDDDTGLYYLNSRYYDPATGRFINADVYVSTGQGIIGNNMYAYCNNNPIMYVDTTGQFPWVTLIVALVLFTPIGGTALQAATSVISYAGIAVASMFDKDIRNDMNSIGWNPFNADESATLNSNKVSFYKGVPVFQISGMKGSMSLGAIFFDKSQGVEVLKHERGHNTQLMSMGIGNYLIQIGIPSVWKNEDKAPWELSASMLGGSALANGYSPKQKQKARNYFIRSMIPIVNIYNVFQYIFY